MVTIKNRRLRFLQLMCLLLTAFIGRTQITIPHYHDSLFSTYYHQRVSLFNALAQTKEDIIFLGNSITDGGEWSELLNDLHIKNRGISGDITAGVINRLDEITNRKPSKIFLLIGVNDLARNISTDSVVKNMLLIAAYIRQQSPATKLYVQSILPVNDVYGKFSTHTNKGEQIKIINTQLKDQAQDYGYTYINLYSTFVDKNGKLKSNLTNDGLHLKGEAYLTWKHIIYPCLYDLQTNPSLIPLPHVISYTNNFFSLFNCKKLLISNSVLMKEAEKLKQQLAEKGLVMDIADVADNDEPAIELKIEKVNTPLYEEKAYRLSVTENKILLTANTAHGIYNGIQTLLQLMRDGSLVPTCEIQDWPAFSWRGFMVDVGRNYQSVKQLKQQIDVMAAYKLNIFHFHLTEDIAWRLESKLYPQLTESKNMIRNPGEYYSFDEMRELIAYCRDRYIVLVPEIDMPGHSDAFKRAMGVDMQTNEGIKICKNILAEICKELNVPYVHIGGDEVNITNKDFIPAMVSELKSLGKKVMAWDPGGKLPAGTLLQMWNGNVKPKNDFPAIDSRHLYLNHFDPIDGVVTTFNHMVCDVAMGDENKLGAILCNWPDRRVGDEADLIKMNAVYPVMLAFAERCWQGGGWKNYQSDIDKPGTENYNAFVAFENRLLDHKWLYFKNSPFPYVKQSNIEWKLIGPFDNKGKTETIFAPELKSFQDTVQLNNYASVYGGTIWLRHFWHPMISSHLKKAEDSSTYYAITKIYAGEAGTQGFWIGFNNLSRSTATDAPPVGQWDNKNSAIWVNGKLIEPPHWQRGGQKGNIEIPLFDEGYEYREPTKIFLQKGWNTVLIKAPVGIFKSDWKNPVKWMFTFIQLK